jgi:hypothetical protein
MSIALYPLYIPDPANGDKPRRVENADQHQRINLRHYEAFQAELAGDPTHGRGLYVATVTAAEERERCAVIAESVDKGKTGARIAAAIRGQIPLNPAEAEAKAAEERKAAELRAAAEASEVEAAQERKKAEEAEAKALEQRKASEVTPADKRPQTPFGKPLNAPAEPVKTDTPK